MQSVKTKNSKLNNIIISLRVIRENQSSTMQGVLKSYESLVSKSKQLHDMEKNNKDMNEDFFLGFLENLEKFVHQFSQKFSIIETEIRKAKGKKVVLENEYSKGKCFIYLSQCNFNNFSES